MRSAYPRRQLPAACAHTPVSRARRLSPWAGGTLALLCAAAAYGQDGTTLAGDFAPADRGRYRELPFRVPPGTGRLTVTLESDAAAQGVSLDVGLRDPARLRGWSGSSKAAIVIEEADATPSYLPGPLPAGTWTLILSAPGIKDRPLHYRAEVRFAPIGAPFVGFVAMPIRTGPRWYRGDLHMHSAHSDGTCASMRGAEVPCPVFRTLEGARAAGLDFIALTDHNSVAQNQALRELAPYFDDLLVIPGSEITMLGGHANVIGPTSPLDFQVGAEGGPGFGRLLDQVEQAGGLISVNHPGADCCRWQVEGVDYRRVSALEVVNGGSLDDTGSAEGRSSFPLWERLLDKGYRISGIAGSDNHDATQRIARDRQGIGRPTTVVFAEALSQPAILAAIRRGHAFVDVYGVPARAIEVIATAGGQRAMMGDAVTPPPDTPVRFDIVVRGVPAGARLAIAGNSGLRIDRAAALLRAGTNRRSLRLFADAAPYWIRCDVRDARGELILVGNPIYLNPRDGAPRT